MSVPEPQPRPRSKKRLILLWIVAPAITIGLVWYFYIRSPVLAEFKVGGFQIQLVKVHKGRLRYHESDPVPRWVRKYAPWVNRVVPPRFPIDFDSAESTHQDGGIWFVFRIEMPPNTLPPVASALIREMEFDEGEHIHKCSSCHHHWQVFIYQADSVPRRTRKLPIRLIEPNGNPIEISIDNPFYREQFTEWTPGPMPAKIIRGPFTVELNDIVQEQGGGFRPITNCSCSDPRLNPCSVTATLEDATGNRGPWISPYEPAWKVVADLRVPIAAPSPLNQRFPVGKIQVPPATTVVPCNLSVKYGKLNLHIRAIVGAGTYELVNGRWKVAVGKKSNGHVSGPAILCDYFTYPHDMTITAHSPKGDQTLLSYSSKSSEFESRSALGLNGYAVGDELEIELTRSKAVRFEFNVAPPKHVNHFWIPFIPGVSSGWAQ